MKRKRIGRLKKRKKSKYTFKNTFKLIFVLGVLVGIFNLAINIYDLYSHLDSNDLDVAFYIENADVVSMDKLQINWQYLAAIDAVRYEKDFTKVNKKGTLELANMFIDKKSDASSGYKLNSLDYVLDKMEFEYKDKKKVHEYVDDLKYVSLSKVSLGNNSNYSDFIEELSDEAIENYYDYGVLPSITVGQAILESGWGKSNLSLKGNNLFGIKADKRWSGKTVKMDTTEYNNQKAIATFRAYNNKKDSLEDHAKFLIENKRYEDNGLFNGSHYTQQAQSLEDAGYSTKENETGEKIYADTLISVIRSYNLQLLDWKAQSNMN